MHASIHPPGDGVGSLGLESLVATAEDIEGNVMNPLQDRGVSTGRRWRKALGKLLEPCFNISGVVSPFCQGVQKRFQGVGKRIKSLKKLLDPLIEIGSAVMGFIFSLDQDLLMPMVKIMMTVYQIISGMPNAIDLKFPPYATQLFNAFAFVNFTSMNFGSPQCFYKYDYVDILMVQTLAPLVVIGLLFLTYLIDHRCRTTPLERSVYITLFFLITYFVLPRYGLPHYPSPHSFVRDTFVYLRPFFFFHSFPSHLLFLTHLLPVSPQLFLARLIASISTRAGKYPVLPST